MKRSPLKRTTPLRAKTTLKRSGPIKTRRRKEEGLAEARKVVFSRSSGRCEARWEVCTGVAQHAHHRLRRSQGGQHTPENLLAVCARCHTAIHDNPARAFDLGHLLRSTD
jgi:hypothetical protein